MCKLFTFSRTRALCATLLCLLSLTRCGGGGGGEENFLGAAELALDATPRTVDTGDRMQVRVSIFNVNKLGIALKIRFPVGLAYVTDSALLQVDEQELAVRPQENVSDEDFTYLVFYLPQEPFGQDGQEQHELLLQLVATTAFGSGLMEVDADVDDPEIRNREEFLLATPEFGAEDALSIRVID